MKYIKIFQKKYGLQPDGKIGPITLKKLAYILNIESKEELSHFLGQTHLETQGFSRGRESMNYSIKGLKPFIKWDRITELEAISYGRSDTKSADQVAIANTIYGGRWGKLNLGNTELNDGWNFRGNGSLQLTGRHNHKLFSEYVNDSEVLINPNIVNEKYYFESGIFYFDKNDVWINCKTISPLSITKVSKHVNLGNPNTNNIPNHLKHREEWTMHYYNLLKDINI